MKKLISLLLTVLMIAGIFAGCGSTESTATTAAPVVTEAGATPAETDAPATEAAATFKTVTSGVLTIAVSPDFAPMEFVDPTKQGQDMYVGFDVTLAKFIAEYLGLELQIMPMSFDACQTAVYAGVVDASISGFSETPERAENYNLSDEYIAGDNESQHVLITLASNGDKYANATELEGIKVGAQNASLQQNLVQEQLPNAQFIPFTDLGTAVLQLKSGDFDCIAVADGNGDAIIAANPDIAKSGFVFETEDEGNVVLIQKGNDALTAAINQALAACADQWSGWYEDAKEAAGIGVEMSFDDDGNAITE